MFMCTYLMGSCREPNWCQILNFQGGLTLSSDGILGPLASDFPVEGLDLSDVPSAVESDEGLDLSEIPPADDL